MLRRLLQTIVVVLIVSLFTFLLLHLIPGDPASIILGPDASQGQVNALRIEMGLNQSIVVQYVHWLANAVHGDLGKSMMYQENVIGVIAQRLPVTAYLALFALLLGTILGILMGIISAVKRGTILDSFISLFANAGIAIPAFWLGISGIYIFGLKLGWLQIQGFVWPTDDFVKSIRLTVMPVICLAIPLVAVIARQTRSSMLEVIRQDYIRTARAKGLKESIVIINHALKNALIPVITLTGMQLRNLVGGSVLVEKVFNINGMGRLLVDSAFNKDFFVLQAGVLLIGVVVCMANLLVDISYCWVDPRIRYE